MKTTCICAKTVPQIALVLTYEEKKQIFLTFKYLNPLPDLGLGLKICPDLTIKHVVQRTCSS